MFSDPFSNLMLVLLLFFCGLLVMFIFMMRNLESNWRNQEEARLQISLSLSDLENKLDALLRLAGANPASVSPQGDGVEMRPFAARPENAAGYDLDEPIYEQACAPAWAAAQEYDAGSGEAAPGGTQTARTFKETPVSPAAQTLKDASEVAYETIEVITAPGQKSGGLPEFLDNVDWKETSRNADEQAAEPSSPSGKLVI